MHILTTQTTMTAVRTVTVEGADPIPTDDGSMFIPARAEITFTYDSDAPFMKFTAEVEGADTITGAGVTETFHSGRHRNAPKWLTDIVATYVRAC